MFDKFEPFKSVQKQNFTFQPTRYELWMGGEMVGSGKVGAVISAKVIKFEGVEKVVVGFSDAKLNGELAENNVFDEFITSNDRLQLVTVPQVTNVENVGIMMFQMNIGATRQRKDFNRNEPFCCNLFLQDGAIAKVTFSYSNPEKLLEFYSEPEGHGTVNLDFVFHSPDHKRYENGRHVSGPHGGAPRAVKVEANVSGGEGYTVTIYYTDSGKAVVQMAPKQMKMIQQSEELMVLRGYGQDAMGVSFADYGLTIQHNGGQVTKCILHMFDRQVDIEYLGSGGDTVLNEQEIVVWAKNAMAQYASENVTDGKQLLAQIYRSVKDDPGQLKLVRDFAVLGAAYLMMLNQEISDDIDALQLIASVGYLCVSKAIEKDGGNLNLYKDRLLLLRIGHQPLTFTVMLALQIDTNPISSMSSLAGYRARDAIYKMEIADLELHPPLYKQVAFFQERKTEFDQLIGRHFFMPEKTLDNVVKSGVEIHKKLLDYLVRRVMEEGDMDF